MAKMQRHDCGVGRWTIFLSWWSLSFLCLSAPLSASVVKALAPSNHVVVHRYHHRHNSWVGNSRPKATTHINNAGWSVLFSTTPETATETAATLDPSTHHETQMMKTLDGRKIVGDLIPLNNFILVRTAKVVEQTEGGILLTGKAKMKKTEGTVIAVGPGRTHPDSGMVVEMPVQVGEGVVYGKYDGTEVKINDVPHTLIRDDDILVKFTAGTQLTIDTVQVTRDNVLVKVDRKEAESESGLLIARSSVTKQNDKPSRGMVVKIGPGKMAANGTWIPMEIKVGDMVKYRDFLGNDVEIDKEEYRVIKMADILAKF